MKKARWILALALAAAACEKGDKVKLVTRYQSYEYPAPDRAEFQVVSGFQGGFTCLTTKSKGVSPTDEEAGHFAERLMTGSGRIAPINAACIAKTYTLSELEYWAKKGDPVAEIGLAYRLLASTDGTCTSSLPIAKYLESSGNRQERWIKARGGKMRVPEVYTMASAIFERCNDAEHAGLLSSRARMNGYAVPDLMR